MDHIKKAKEHESHGRYDDAIASYLKALEADPKNYFIQIEIGNLYALNNNFEEASGYLRRAHRYFPDNAALKNGLIFCLNAIGNDYHNGKKYELAEAAFEEALSFDTMRADILYNLANACFAQKNYKEALPLYQRSLAIEKSADTHNNLANTYSHVGNFLKAREHYVASLSLKNNTHTLVELTHLKQNICDWDKLDEYQSTIANEVRNKKGKVSPFTVLSMPNFTASQQLNTSSLWAQQYQLPAFKKKNHGNNAKPVIGYLSADFRQHPLYSLIFDVFKHHNLDDFTVKLFYSGFEEHSAEYKNFRQLPFGMHEVNTKTDIELATLIEEENIDILVDLSGFTQNSRSMIAALRPARFHINWLGFAGSLGYFNHEPVCDFILADEYLIPPTEENNYAEKVLRIAGCYQPNISHRPQLKKIKKVDLGFQDDDFIFASFGQSIKISQERFDSWLKILASVPNAKLWLLESNTECSNNLWSYAEKQGIAPERIKFAPKVDYDAHINRHQIIDIFLDTFPYNAHTSASDALWTTCPVITRSGTTFASRVAGSILTSMGCEELICPSEEDFIKKAIYLATHRTELNLLKVKIKEKIETSDLFKPALFTQRLESLYKSLLSGGYKNT